MNGLTQADLRFVAQRLPRDIRDLLSKHAGRLFVGGGFVRAIVAGEEPNDIDIFGDTKERLDLVAKDLAEARPGSKIHRTKNATTLLTPERMPVQFITRWTFDSGPALVRSFDFTVCQAAVWRAGSKSNDPWMSSCSDRFYIDLAGRRLVYTSPVREEEAGGSLLRVLKYVRRGYSIQVNSLGGVIARLTSAMQKSDLADSDPQRVLAGLLREVDPLLVVDGFEIVDDHEPIEGETT